MAERRIELYADGVLREARTLVLDPQRRTDVSIDDIDELTDPANVIEVRLAAKDETSSIAADPLAVDDRAWAIVPPTELRTILRCRRGDQYRRPRVLRPKPSSTAWRPTIGRPSPTGDHHLRGYLPAECPTRRCSP